MTGRGADGLQYEIGSGPCVDAATADAVHLTGDVASDGRWPVFGPRAAAGHGVRSMLSYRLGPEVDNVIAALNVYADENGAWTGDDLVDGLLLATHGSAALAVHLSRQRSDDMERALGTNREIGVAVGILMDSRRLGRHDAFDLLRIASQHSRRSPGDLPTEVGDTGRLPLPALAE